MDIVVEQGTIVKIEGQPRLLYSDLVVKDVPETFLDDQEILDCCWLDKREIGL